MVYLIAVAAMAIQVYKASVQNPVDVLRSE